MKIKLFRVYVVATSVQGDIILDHQQTIIGHTYLVRLTKVRYR